MKRFLHPLISLVVFSFFSALNAQNVNVEVQIIEVERSNYSDCWACSGSPDPTWVMWGNTNGSGGAQILTTWKYHYENMSGTTWGGHSDQIIYHNNTNATAIILSFEGWEENCGSDGSIWEYDSGFWCFGFDDSRHAVCNNFYSINFRNYNACQWDTFTTNWCGSYRYKVRVYWTWNEAPTVTSHPTPADRSLCIGTPTTLTVITNSGASPNPGRFFQWQYSINTDCSAPGTWYDVTSAYNGGSPGTGYTTASYTPPQIPGTRLYRAKITSNCIAYFSTLVSYSNCTRVTYHPMGSPGDLPPMIQAGICGQTVLPGSVNTLNTVVGPTPGAATNVTYSWSASGGTFLSTGSTALWKAPTTPGPYSITVTYIPNNGSCSSYSSAGCNVTVASPSCGDYKYVATTGLNNSGCGGPDNPCATVSYLIDNVLGASRYIRVASGNYDETGIINMVDNLVIEGKYTYSGGVWTKTNSATANTVLNCRGFENAPGGNASVCHRLGVRSFNANNWTLMDLNINTSAVNNVSNNGRGCSNYGILIYNSNNYKIIRCDISSGAAAQGSPGTPWSGAGSAGGGGAGGAGGGGSLSKCGCGYGFNNGYGVAGSAGNGGAGGGAGGSRDGCDGCNWYGCDADGGNGGSGSPGGNGGAGADASGTPATPGAATQYYLPGGQAASGGNGYGGGGGGGGGGGDVGTCCLSCPFSGCGHDRYPNGGAGGAGGGGGFGGQGGFGGGGSFAVYASGTGSGSIGYFNTAAGSGGAGGAGAPGQPGGPGAGGALGLNSGGCEDGTGGSGGNGGTGGSGGTGQTGASGLSQSIVVVSPHTLTQTNPGNNPTNPALTLFASNQDYCRNSEIVLGKASGTWTFPAGLNIVNDKRDAPAGPPSSSYNTSSSPISVYTTSTSTAFDLTINSTFYDDALKIGPDLRPVPTISVVPSTVCYQGTAVLSASLWRTVREHDWKIYTGDVITAPYFSSSLSNPTTPAMTCPSTYPCTHTIRYRQREECCGWSVPVFSGITVLPQFSRGRVDNTGKTICYNTQANTSISFTSLPTGSGGFSYQWYYRQGASCPTSSSTSGWTAIGSNSSTLSSSDVNSIGNLTQSVTFACWVSPTGTAPICGTADWAESCFIVTVLPQFDAGKVQEADQGFCAGGNPAEIFMAPEPQGSGFTYQWYYNIGNIDTANPYNTSGWPTYPPPCPGASNGDPSLWHPIAGATGSSYDPPPINLHDTIYNKTGQTTSNTLYIGYAVYITPVAVGGLPQCSSSGVWADNCRVIAETDGQFYVNNLIPGLGQFDQSTNIWKRKVCYGYNGGCTPPSPPSGNCTYMDVHPTTNGGDATYRVKWDSSPDFAAWTTFHVDSPATGSKRYTFVDSFNQSIYYRAVILPISPPCGDEQDAANYLYYEVLEPFDAGEITGDVSSTQCYSYDPPPLTANPVGIFPDHYNNSSLIYTDYKWEKSIDGGANWSIVSNYATGDPHDYNKTYDPGALTQSTMFRYWVRPTGFTSTDCYGVRGVADDAVGDTITYTILPQFNPGNITPDTFARTQCLTYDPPMLSISSSGATGIFSYQWQESSNGTSGWTDILGATGSTYDHFTPLMDSIYFRVVVDPIGSPDCPSAVSNNVVDIKIGPSTPANAGSDATICSSQYTFSANDPEGPGVGTWTTTGSGTFNDDNLHNATVFGLDPFSNVFKWEIVTPLCVTTFDYVTITRHEEPDNPNAGADLYLCDFDSVQLNGNSLSVVGAIGTWSHGPIVAGAGGVILEPHNPDTWVDNLESGLTQFVWTTSHGVCPDKQDMVNVFTSITPYMTWNGSVSNNWNDPANWGCGNIPGIATKAIIPFAGNLPVIKGGNVGICDDIVIQPGASLTINNWAKMGVDKDFVWAYAGPDLTKCNNDPPFNIGAQYVTGQDDYTDYLWTETNDSVDFTVLLSDPTSPEPVVTLSDPLVVGGDTIQVPYIDFILTAQHQGDITNIDSDTMRLTINYAPQAYTGPDQVYCLTPVQLGQPDNSGGTHTFTWTPTGGLSDPEISNPTASPAVTTNYTLTEVITASGCTKANTVLVTKVDPPVATLDASPNPLCSGQSATLTFTITGAGPYDVTYTTNGGSPQTLNNINSGHTVSTGVLTDTTVYQITNVNDDGSGCSSPSGGSETVYVNPSPSVSITPASVAFCKGGNATLTANGSGGTPSYSYLWSNGANTQDINVSPNVTTNYTVTVTDANGCTATATRTVTVYDKPTVSSDPETATICSGSSVTFTANVTGGTPSFSYSWAPGGATSQSITVSPSSSTDYSVTVTDANGCTATDGSHVTVNASVSVSISSNPSSATICDGATATLTAVPSPSPGNGYTYLWSTGATSTAINVSPTPPNTYNYSVTITDVATGCTATASKTVTVNALPSASYITERDTSGSTMDDAIICDLDSAWLTATGSGGTSPYTYAWSHSLGSGTGPKKVKPSANTTYSVTVTDNKGCTAAPAKLITVNPKPSAGINETDNSGTTADDSRICNGYGGTTLTGTGGSTYTWSPNIGSGAGPHTVAPASTTTYYLTVTDGNGCRDDDSETVTVDALPAPPTWNETYATACTGSNGVPYSVNGAGGNYTWSLSNGCIQCTGCSGTGSSVTLDFTGCPTGNYTISVTETNPSTNCTSAALTQAVSVVTGSPPNISSPPSNSTICENSSTTFTVSATGTSLTYQWQVNTGSGWSNITAAGSNPTYANWDQATLQVNNVAASNNGYQYRCRVSGTCPPAVTSSSATLTVNTEPAISAHPSDASRCAGSSVTFSVTASGSSITYQWQEDPNTGTFANISNGGVYSGATTSSLSISDVTGKNNYKYRCVVTGICPSNPTSVNSASATLTVNVSSTAPSGISVKVLYCLSTDNATANGSRSTTITVNGGSLGTGASWKWYTGSCGGTLKGSGSSYTLGSSDPSTTYYVRAEGTCSNTSCASLSVTNYYSNANDTVTHNEITWEQRPTKYDIEVRSQANCSSGTGAVNYTWNSTKLFYESTASDKILIPNTGNTTVTRNGLPGYRGNTTWNKDGYAWDSIGNSCCGSGSALEFDARNIIVSPISSGSMTYCKALDDNGGSALLCNSTSPNSCIKIDGSSAALAYPSWSPAPTSLTTYNVWTNGTGSGCTVTGTMELIDYGGALNGTNNDYISQQNLLPGNVTNQSYCVKTFGKGWRLPTDVEMGHTNDNTGLGQGFDNPYRTESSFTTSRIIWTSSQFNTSINQRWSVRIDNSASFGQWQTSGFNTVSLSRYVRCVYNGGY